MEASMAQEKKNTLKCHTDTYLQKKIFIARTVMKAKMMSRESCR